MHQIVEALLRGLWCCLLACAVIICGRESFLRTTVIHTTNSLFLLKPALIVLCTSTREGHPNEKICD